LGEVPIACRPSMMAAVRSLCLAVGLAGVACLLQGCGGGGDKSNTIPDVASKTPSLSTLVKALKNADLTDTLAGPGPFTVFAPTNDAFVALPYLLGLNKTALTKVLNYHVASGKVESSDLTNNTEEIKTREGQNVSVKLDHGNVMVNNAIVATPNVEASNGVVHIINEVLIPPGYVRPTIPEVAAATPDLSTLVKALNAAHLVDTLAGTGPFTVFAPTNEAFKAMPAGVLEALLKPANVAKLKDVLKYHVHSGKVERSNLTNGEKIDTLAGKQVNVTISGSSVKINDANVTIPDVLAGNGVVHVIGSVLIPPDFVPPNKSAVKNIKDILI